MFRCGMLVFQTLTYLFVKQDREKEREALDRLQSAGSVHNYPQHLELGQAGLAPGAETSIQSPLKAGRVHLLGFLSLLPRVHVRRKLGSGQDWGLEPVHCKKGCERPR